MVKYDLIYSLGADCAGAEYLKRHKLRLVSGPFDWLRGNSFEKRMELILNDFDDFLNLKDFVKLPKDEEVWVDDSNDYYKNVSTEFYHYHDFAKEVPIEQSIDAVRAKYEKRILRFYDKIIRAKNPLLVWLSHNQKTENEVIKDLAGKLEEKTGRRINFLLIENDDEIIGVREVSIAPNIKKYKLRTKAFDSEGNVTTLGNIAELDKLFSKIKISTSLWHKLKRGILRLVSLFIFNEERRKKFKKKYWL